MDDIQAIRLAKTELREAYRTGNLKRALSVFSNEYSHMAVGEASFWGAEARAVLRYQLGELFRQYRTELTITIISIGIQGTMAFDWGWHKLKLVPKKKGHRSTTRRTRYLEIWQKESDGQWRISIFMDNLDVPPKMPPTRVLREMNTKKL